MKVVFQIAILSAAMHGCQTVQLKSMVFDEARCKNPEKEVWTDYRFNYGWSKEKVEIRQEMEKIYASDLSNLSSRQLRDWRLELGPFESGMANVRNLPEPVREAASKLLNMKNCINPEAKEMSDRHYAFIEKLDVAITSAIARDEEQRKKSSDAAVAAETKACDEEQKFSAKRGLRATCGLPLSNLVYGIINNEVTESEVRRSIVSINYSHWSNEQAFQALSDMALFMAENGRFIIMIKSRGIIQGQTLSAIGSEFVFQGISQYQSNFGPRQAFVFTVLNR